MTADLKEFRWLVASHNEPVALFSRESVVVYLLKRKYVSVRYYHKAAQLLEP